MKITMYELLEMIKDGKLPKKIKFDTEIYIWCEEQEEYRRYPYDNNLYYSLCQEYDLIKCLNDEVEIIEKPQEHKMPEKLDIVLLDQSDNWTRKYNKNLKNFESAHIELNPYVIDVIRQNTLEFQSKINEILDYLEVCR